MEEAQKPKKKTQMLSVADAVALIKSDTRKDPKVDAFWIAKRRVHLTEICNFRIPLLTRLENGRIVRNGSVYAMVRGARDMTTLNYAIIDHYKEVSSSHTELDPDLTKVPVKAATTTINERTGNFSASPSLDPDAPIQAGQDVPQSANTSVMGK